MATAVTIFGLGIMVAAGWLWYRNNHEPAFSNSITPTPGSGPEGIQLTSKETPASNELSVLSDSTNYSLGQLGASDEKTSSTSPKPIDPATFGEYEKYKDADEALFAEIKRGSGEELSAGKKAAVYYKGWLTDGTLFDMTRTDDEGTMQPFVFEMGVHQVIPGWEQGLYGMKVGGSRLIIVPPAVGYGEAGQDQIPGDSVLIFEVQLLAVQ